MFGTDWSLSFLSMCSQWHVDDTFDVRSLLFEQVYVVCGHNAEFMILCIYTLSTKKDKLTHSEVLFIILSNLT